jgi:hypothetical protein
VNDALSEAGKTWREELLASRSEATLVVTTKVYQPIHGTFVANRGFCRSLPGSLL